MFVQLWQNGTKLEHKSTVVSSQVDWAFEDFSRWATFQSWWSIAVAIQPVIDLDNLSFSCFFLANISYILALRKEVILVYLNSLRLPWGDVTVIIGITSFFSFLLRLDLLHICHFSGSWLWSGPMSRWHEICTSFRELSLGLRIFRGWRSIDTSCFDLIRIHRDCPQLMLGYFLALICVR